MKTQEQKTEWTLKRLLEWTSGYLGESAVEQGRLCAEILLAHVLGYQRIDLYVKFDFCPDAEQLGRYRELVKRCARGEPVAYLTGKAHFYSLEFAVSPAVLIPRPETEVLVTEAIDYVRRQTVRPTVAVLDLCTGSGCVAVAIAANAVEAEVVAADRSGAALEVARRNVEKHDLQGRVVLVESDMFGQVGQSGKGVFDLIVSNPPYISTGAFGQLPAVVRDYEPKEALLGGEDGLDYYRRMAGEAREYLAEDGALMVEVGYDQAEAVAGLLEASGYLHEISTVKDELGHRRVVKAVKVFDKGI